MSDRARSRAPSTPVEPEAEPAEGNDVEVLSISRATSILEGAPIFQVVFGKLGQPAPGLIQGGPVLSPVSAIYLVMFVSDKLGSAYRVGSRWRIAVSPSGTVTVKAITG